MSHDRPPTKELTFGTGDAIVLSEGTRILPVTEANTIVVGASSQIEDDTEDNQSRDSYDLDGSVKGGQIQKLRSIKIMMLVHTRK